MALNEIPPLQLKFFRRPVDEVPEEVRQIPQSRLKLYRGSEDAGLYVSSPFVTKIEFRLRLAGIPYALDAGAPWLGPKGKIPYMEIAPERAEEKATMLGDSALIIQHLVGNQSVGDLNAHLRPAEKAKDLAMRSLLEDKLYFYHMRECWVDNYYLQRDQALWAVPLPIRVFVGRNVYKKVTTTLYGQGVGRYTSAEVQSFREEVWGSMNDVLEDARTTSESENTTTPFWILGGPEPTEADITLYSFVASILAAKSCPGSQKLLKSLPAVMDYAERIHNAYFDDYTKWTSDVAASTGPFSRL